MKHRILKRRRDGHKQHYWKISVKRPKKIGSSWSGPKYIHGPRKVKPEDCNDFRLGKVQKDGSRLVLCKKDGKWIVQSKITPKNYGSGIPIDKDRQELLKKLQENQDRERKRREEEENNKISGLIDQLESKPDISRLKKESIELQQKGDLSEQEKQRLIDITNQIKEKRNIGGIKYTEEEIKLALGQEEREQESTGRKKPHVTLDSLRWRLELNRKYGR